MERKGLHTYTTQRRSVSISHTCGQSQKHFVSRPLVYSLKQEMTRTLWCWWHVEARAGS